MRSPQSRHNFGASSFLALFVVQMALLACSERAPPADDLPWRDAHPLISEDAAQSEDAPAQGLRDAALAPSDPDALSPVDASTALDAGLTATAVRGADAAIERPPPASNLADAAPNDRDVSVAMIEDARSAQGLPACTGNGGASGEKVRSITSSGKTRTFIRYAPTTIDANHPTPVVLVFHGANMSAAAMRDLTGFKALADAHGFIAVFPDGEDEVWNIRPADTAVCGIGELFTNPAVDDLRFVDDMLTDLAESYCLDRGHIFATGFSMGGYFTNHLACQRPELLRAAAPHSAGTYPGPCKGKVPMLILHGTDDQGVDLACGTSAHSLWLERNGCTVDAGVGVQEPIKRGHCERHQGCPERAPVTLCLFDDMCHAWAGHGTGELLCLADFGSGPSYEDASALIWRFFAANW